MLRSHSLKGDLFLEKSISFRPQGVAVLRPTSPLGAVLLLPAVITSTIRKDVDKTLLWV